MVENDWRRKEEPEKITEEKLKRLQGDLISVALPKSKDERS